MSTACEVLLAVLYEVGVCDVEVVEPLEIGERPLVVVDTSGVTYDFTADRRTAWSGLVRLTCYADDVPAGFEVWDALQDLESRCPWQGRCRFRGDPTWSGTSGAGLVSWSAVLECHGTFGD